MFFQWTEFYYNILYLVNILLFIFSLLALQYFYNSTKLVIFHLDLFKNAIDETPNWTHPQKNWFNTKSYFNSVTQLRFHLVRFHRRFTNKWRTFVSIWNRYVLRVEYVIMKLFKIMSRLLYYDSLCIFDQSVFC